MVGLVFGFTAWRFGRQLLGIYITDSQQAIEYGMVRLALICLPYFLCGLMDVSTGALRGLGASVVPMVISVLGVCGLRIVWICSVFQVYHTPECLFFSYTVSWVVTFLFQLAAFYIVCRRFPKE